MLYIERNIALAFLKIAIIYKDNYYAGRHSSKHSSKLTYWDVCLYVNIMTFLRRDQFCTFNRYHLPFQLCRLCHHCDDVTNDSEVTGMNRLSIMNMLALAVESHIKIQNLF